jgi:heme/copper-type cytochrome/quinol oxidase subunit 2
MPIVVRAVPPAEFETWVASARTRFADTMPARPALAAAGADPIHIATARP